MLKRLFILTIAVCIFLSLASVSHACEVLKTSQTVSKVSYSEHDKVFYAYTKAVNGSMWVVEIEPNKGETLKQFQKRIVGKTIDIYYIENDDENGDEEIIKTVIH